MIEKLNHLLLIFNIFTGTYYNILFSFNLKKAVLYIYIYTISFLCLSVCYRMKIQFFDQWHGAQSVPGWT